MALFDGVTFRERIGKIILLVFAFGFLFSFSASAQDCSSQANNDINTCETGVKAPSNNTGGCQQGQNMPGGGGAQAQVAGTAAQGEQQGIDNCKAKQKDCDSACDQAASQAQQTNPGLAAQDRQMKNQCDTRINSAIAQGTAALASLSQGASGAASSAAASTGGSGAQACSDSKPPQIPPPPPPSPASSPQPAPTPISAPTPSPSASACAIGDTTCEGQNMLNDGGLGASFFGPKTGTTGTGSNIIDSTSTPSGVGTSGMSPPTGGSGSTSSGSSSGGLPAGTTKSNAEGTNGSGGHANPNEGTPGSSDQIMEAGGGGGASGSGGNNSYGPLSAYLPGGAKQPSRTPAAMAAGKGIAHADITSKHSNMFDQIRIRMELLCKMKELIGCN